MRWLVMVGVISLFFTATPAEAGGTISGLTGLVEVLTADVLPPQGVRVSGYYDSGSQAFQPSVAFGILPGLEVAINGSTGGAGGKGELGLGAKIGLMAESARQPGLALGFTWSDAPSFYGTLSKRVGSLWRLHGGVATDRDIPIFVGVSGLLNPVQAGGGLPPTTLIIEADADTLRVGTRFNLARGLDATLAIRNLKAFQAGISYQTRF